MVTRLAVLGLLAAGAYGGATHSEGADAQRACTIFPAPPDTGYDPTRLVRDAQVVVIARADSQTYREGGGDGRRIPMVHLTVTETIDAGTMPVPQHLRFFGGLTSRPDFNPGTVAVPLGASGGPARLVSCHGVPAGWIVPAAVARAERGFAGPVLGRPVAHE